MTTKPAVPALPQKYTVERHNGEVFLCYDGKSLATFGFSDTSFLAAQLVARDLNTHEGLVEALEFMVRDLECCGKDAEMYKTAMNKAKSALAAAKGEKQ